MKIAIAMTEIQIPRSSRGIGRALRFLVSLAATIGIGAMLGLLIASEFGL